MGWVEVTRNDVTLSVDFLSRPHGLTLEEVEKFRVAVGYGNKTLKVMHPVHCLISRTCNVVELPEIYNNAHGLHQLRACVAMVHGFILQTVARRGVDGALKSAKRVFEFAKQRPALAAFETHGIDVYDSVPTTELGDNFLNIGRPRNVQTLDSARQKFRNGPKYIY